MIKTIRRFERKKNIADSRIVFPSKYELIKKQDRSKPDYIDLKGGQKYGAKLLFENECCRALSKNQIQEFMNKLMDLIGIDFPSIRVDVPFETELYKEMEKRINFLKADEDEILFLPFPAAMSFRHSYLDIICSNQFDYCFGEMKINKNIYLITINF